MGVLAVLMEATKRCRSCGCDRKLHEFYANAKGRSGRHSLCKQCMNAMRAASHAAAVAAGDARVPATKPCSMCRQTLPAGDFSRSKLSGDGLRTYCRNCDRIVRRSGKYGLSRERVAEMLTQSSCEACGDGLTEDADKHIDHRHFDGAVRGILCSRCNTTIGQCKESEAILLRLCDYLRRTQFTDYRTQPYLEQKADSPATSHAEPFPPKGTASKCQTNTTNHPISPQP